MSDLLGPHEVFEHLATLLREIATIVQAHRGTTDRSLGDGVLCVFGYDQGRRSRQHTRDAFLAAKKIQEMIVEKFQGTPLDRTFILPVRIGIHVADVLIGDLGGVQRLDFSMIGSGVNFASRLETACSPFKVMLSEECYAPPWSRGR